MTSSPDPDIPRSWGENARGLFPRFFDAPGVVRRTVPWHTCGRSPGDAAAVFIAIFEIDMPHILLYNEYG